jgi:L-fuconolactonase
MQLDEVDREDAALEVALDPTLAIVDAHHHLWPPGFRIPYDLAAMEADVQRVPAVEATVFVECMTSFRPGGDEALQPIGETEFVVAATEAAGVPAIAAGIVGWADLLRPDQVGRTLDGHMEAGKGRFRGVRFNVVWHERVSSRHAGRPTTPHMLLGDRLRASLHEIARRDLTYDVWLYHPQLPELALTLDAVPELTFIVNHLGGPIPDDETPQGRSAAFDSWRRGLAEVARRPNVLLKIGGVGMPVYGFAFDGETRPTSAVLAEAWRPYIETAIEAFGPDRCILESNFPVDKQSFSYDSLWNAFKLLTKDHSVDERAALFAGTAKRAYRLT